MFQIRNLLIRISVLTYAFVLTQNQCGRRHQTRTYFQPGTSSFHIKNADDDKIFGGREAAKNSWPWMALLGILKDGKASWLCGGSLINEKWVLTAAHCIVEDINIVRLGEHDINNHEESSVMPEDFFVETALWFPEYQRSRKIHDLALVKLFFEGHLPPRFRPVCLPSEGVYDGRYTGKDATVAGWGVSYYYGEMSSKLRQVDITIYDVDKCRKAYSTDEHSYKQNWPDGMKSDLTLCAGHSQSEGDSCLSDSGGPLMIRDHEKFTLVGVVSSGYGCGKKDYPGLYTPIFEDRYLKWIKETAFGNIISDVGPKTTLRPTTTATTLRPTATTTTSTLRPTATKTTTTTTTLRPQVANLVSFYRGDPGYVKLPSPDGRGLQLVFKFKTQSPDGLLFYTETSDRSIYLSLSLVEGALILRSAPGGEITTGSFIEYNDSAWHFVIATREDNKLRLNIDDVEQFADQFIQDGPVFFGGIPDYHNIDAVAAAADSNFFGCIGDVTLNGQIVNFATADKRDRPGAMLEMCSLTKEVTSKTVVAEADGILDVHYPSRLPGRQTTPPTTSLPPTTESAIMEVVTPPFEQCALPVVPEADDDIGAENGARFGYNRDSRIEYNTLPADIRLEFTLALDFKTEAEEGIIFYVASINHKDFVAIYMKDGRIVFSFNAGIGPAIMRTKPQFNDNKWHKLIVSRQGTAGKLLIDGFIEANGTSQGRGGHIEHALPYYFGGININISEIAADYMERTYLSFSGCLRGFRMNNQMVGGARSVIGVQPCSYKVEQGVFFAQGPRSHIVVRARFHVGIQFSIALDIKPRKNNGVIMSVHGKRDFVLLQLNNGDVEFKIDNGKGIFSTSYSLSNEFKICDGNWHSIEVLKKKNLAILLVDGIIAAPASGQAGDNSADTNNPLFLGSQPRLAKRMGDAVHEKYVGCMKNVVLNGDKVELPYTLLFGTTYAGACPLV